MARNKLIQLVQYHITPPNFNQQIIEEMMWGEENTSVSACKYYIVEEQLKENELALIILKRIPGFKTKYDWIISRKNKNGFDTLSDHILIINYNDINKIKYMKFPEYKPMTLEKYLNSFRIDYKSSSWRTKMLRKLFENI